MRRIIDFYRLQIQVMREWQPSGSSRLRRIVVTLLISVVSLGGAVFLTPGFDMVPGSPVIGTLLLGAIILGLLNLLVRPVFLALFAGISVIAVAIATISFQIATFLLLGRLVDQLAGQRDPRRPRRVPDLRDRSTRSSSRSSRSPATTRTSPS